MAETRGVLITVALIGAAGSLRTAWSPTCCSLTGTPTYAEGAHRLAELVDAPVGAIDPAHRLGSEGLADGDVVAAAGLEIRVLATPGHTSDSLGATTPRAGPLAGRRDRLRRRGPVLWPAADAAVAARLQCLRGG